MPVPLWIETRWLGNDDVKDASEALATGNETSIITTAMVIVRSPDTGLYMMLFTPLTGCRVAELLTPGRPYKTLFDDDQFYTFGQYKQYKKTFSNVALPP